MSEFDATVAVVGPGRLGSVLGRSLVAAGIPVSEVAGHGPEGLASSLRARAVATEAVGADVVLLTVPDSAIETVARAVLWRPGQVAIHCSGAVGLDVLDSARARGAARASLHPFQTIASRDEPASLLQGSAAVVEADPEAHESVLALARLVGLRPVALRAAGRALYHAAGSIASNYLVTLWSAAASTLVAAGFQADDAPALLGPLMRTTLSNLEQRGTAALTGPISRGDLGTVQRHLTVLPDAVLPLYRCLGVSTAQLAADLGRIDAMSQRDIEQLLAIDSSPVPAGHPAEEGSR